MFRHFYLITFYEVKLERISQVKKALDKDQLDISICSDLVDRGLQTGHGLERDEKDFEGD